MDKEKILRVLRQGRRSFGQKTQRGVYRHKGEWLFASSAGLRFPGRAALEAACGLGLSGVLEAQADVETLEETGRLCLNTQLLVRGKGQALMRVYGGEGLGLRFFQDELCCRLEAAGYGLDQLRSVGKASCQRGGDKVWAWGGGLAADTRRIDRWQNFRDELLFLLADCSQPSAGEGIAKRLQELQLLAVASKI